MPRLYVGMLVSKSAAEFGIVFEFGDRTASVDQSIAELGIFARRAEVLGGAFQQGLQGAR